MEFPHLGRNCAFRTCNRLDFLPYKCGACLESFCSDHFAYSNHECPAQHSTDAQVPECPLCGAPVPGRRGEQPDVAVGRHIDNQCQSDPATERRRVFTNRCSYKGCKTKEMMPVVCNECELNYCLKHRHSADHACEGAFAAKRRKAAPPVRPAKVGLNSADTDRDSANESPDEAMRRKAAEAAMARMQNGKSKKIDFKTRIASNPGRARVATLNDVQGNMTEDDALAAALAMSLQGASLGGADLAIARSLTQRVGASSGQPRPRPYRRRYSSGDTSGSDLHLNMFDIFKVVGAIILTLYVLASLKYMFKTSDDVGDTRETYYHDNDLWAY